MLKIFRLLLLLLVLPVLVGCAATIPHVIISDFDKRGTRLIRMPAVPERCFFMEKTMDKEILILCLASLFYEGMKSDTVEN